MLFFIKSKTLTGFDLYDRLNLELEAEFRTLSSVFANREQLVISLDVNSTNFHLQDFINVLTVRLHELIAASNNMQDCKVSTSVSNRTGVVFNRVYNFKHEVFIDAAYFSNNKLSVLSKLTLLKDFNKSYTVSDLRRHGMREKMIKINYLDSLMQDLDNLAFQKPHARSEIFEIYSKTLIQKHYLLGHDLFSKEIVNQVKTKLIDFTLKHSILDRIDFDYVVIKYRNSVDDKVPSSSFLTKLFNIEIRQQLRFNVLMSKSVKDRLYYHHIYYVEQRYEQKAGSFYLHRRKQQLLRKLKTANKNNQRLALSHKLYSEGLTLSEVSRKVKARITTVKKFLNLDPEHDFTRSITEELVHVERLLKNPKKYRKLTSKVRFLIRDIDRLILKSKPLESIYIISDKRAKGQVFKRHKLRYYIRKRYREIQRLLSKNQKVF